MQLCAIQGFSSNVRACPRAEARKLHRVQKVHVPNAAREFADGRERPERDEGLQAGKRA